MDKIKIRLAVLVFLGLGPLGLHAQTKTTPPPASTAPTDTEDNFYDTEEPTPSEEMNDTPESDDANFDRNENPDDGGLQYSDEGEPNPEDEPSAAKTPAPQQAKPAPKPPVDEPMPLIRRERETVAIPVKPQPTRIKHPNASKGLTKITRDKVYIYKVKESDQTKAASFRFGFIAPNNLQNPETADYYDQFYDPNNPALQFDYEWQLFRKVGKFGIKVGTGLALASGTGRFKNDLNGEREPKEKFTFVYLPNSVGGIIRLQFFKKQWFVPYGEGGGTVFTFGEFRDDGKNPKFGAAFGGYFAAGVALNLGLFNELSMLELDREYSINSIFLNAEYRHYQGVGDFDFTSDYINGGLTVEF